MEKKDPKAHNSKKALIKSLFKIPKISHKKEQSSSSKSENSSQSASSSKSQSHKTAKDLKKISDRRKRKSSKVTSSSSKSAVPNKNSAVAVNSKKLWDSSDSFAPFWNNFPASVAAANSVYFKPVCSENLTEFQKGQLQLMKLTAMQQAELTVFREIQSSEPPQMVDWATMASETSATDFFSIDLKMPYHPQGMKVKFYTKKKLPREISVSNDNIPLGIRAPVIRSPASHFTFPPVGNYSDYLSRYLDLVVLTDKPNLYMSEERILSWAIESPNNMVSLQNVVGKLEVPSVITPNHIVEWIKANPEEFLKIQGQFLNDSSGSDVSDTEEKSTVNSLVTVDDYQMEQQ